MRDVLNGVGGSSSLIVRAARHLRARSAPAAPAPSRIRRSAGSPARRSARSTASASAVIVAHDRFRVQLRHPRRADHDRRRAERLRLPRVSDAGPRAVGRRAGDDADAAGRPARRPSRATVRALARRSSRATSPVTPSAVTPLTPAPMNRSTTRLRLSTSRSPPALNGVGRTENTPSNATQPPTQRRKRITLGHL